MTINNYFRATRADFLIQKFNRKRERPPRLFIFVLLTKKKKETIFFFKTYENYLLKIL